MQKSSHEPKPAQSAGDPLPLTPWILLVDDEPLVRQLIDTVLAGQGWTVKLADGAEAALALLNAATTPPAVMICDVMMPKTDGLELTRRMRARVPHLGVILISGHLADSAWWPADLGQIRLLKKPFLNEELVTAVQEALENHRARD